MILATAGHIDHGKTALVRALTGIDADRLPEEKRRGMTIDLGFAYATLLDGTELGFVDVPGHERFLPNMLAGVLSIDRVLLVVAADDGPRPQTLEHLDVLELIGVGAITGIITKIDRVDAARAAAVAEQVRGLLAAAGHPASPIFPVSSATGEGIAALAEHLRGEARAAAAVRAAAEPPGLFRMPIDRAFTLPGIGLVVTGTIASGRVAPGERLTVSPRGVEARVRGLHAQNRPVDGAIAGERCAVNLVGSFPAGGEPQRGDWLLAPERHMPTSRLDLSLKASRLAETGLRDGLPVHLHLGTADVVGRTAVLGARAMAPGERGLVQVDLDASIAALAGDRAILRDHAQRHTLAGGRVVDPFPPRRGRSRPARLAALAALGEAASDDAMRRLVAIEGAVDFSRFALVRNLTPAEVDALAAGENGFLCVGPARGRVAIAPERLDALGEALLATLGEWHRAQPDMLGPTRPALVARLRRGAPPAAIEAAFARLAAEGRILAEGAMWRLPDHRPKLAPADEKLWRRFAPLLDVEDLRPPRVRELAEALQMEPQAVERLLIRAERIGRVARVAPNRFFLPQTIARLAAIARELAAAARDGSFGAATFKDRSGVGRNLTIQILEYLDSIGATQREGDSRVVLPGAAELFD